MQFLHYSIGSIVPDKQNQAHFKYFKRQICWLFGSESKVITLKRTVSILGRNIDRPRCISAHRQSRIFILSVLFHNHLIEDLKLRLKKKTFLWRITSQGSRRCLYSHSFNRFSTHHLSHPLMPRPPFVELVKQLECLKTFIHLHSMPLLSWQPGYD